jgi:hypothetical protein
MKTLEEAVRAKERIDAEILGKAGISVSGAYCSEPRIYLPTTRKCTNRRISWTFLSNLT